MSMFTSLCAVEESELDGNHLVITCKISVNDSSITSHALIDCGATGFAFIDKDFAATHDLPLYPLHHPRTIEVIDGRPISSGKVIHMTKVRLTINGHKEELPAFITTLGRYPIVLRKPWLKKHDVSIRFATDTVAFDSDYCLSHCVNSAVKVKGISIDTPNCSSIAMISAAAFRRTTKRKDNFAFKLSVYDIDQALVSRGPLDEDNTDEEARIKRLIPKEYHGFAPLFSEVSANNLPPHRPYDHKISLKEDFHPPFDHFTHCPGPNWRPYGSGWKRTCERDLFANHHHPQVRPSYL